MKERRKRGWQPSGPEQPAGSVKSVTRMPDRGPWCPLCQYEFADGKKDSIQSVQRHTQAYLAFQSKLVITCTGCAEKIIPVMGFDDGMKPPEGATNEPSRKVDVREDSQRIIQSIFKIDLWPSWEKIHKNLTMGEKRNDYATVQKTLDEAEENARLAHQVFVNFKIELKSFEIETEINRSAMYDEANSILQAEKNAKARSKGITNADVKAKMAEMHPREFQRVELELEKFKLAVDHAAVFAKIWSDRARDLNTIFGKMRGGGER